MAEETAGDGDETRTAHPAERKIRRALTQIRREGWKAATIYAVVDATLVALLVNLVGTVSLVPRLPDRLSLPGIALDALEAGGIVPTEPTIATSTVLGVLVGAVVFTTEVGWRVRKPLVEQFESANPELREALRTARDAVEDGTRSRIALRLYEDVLEELERASSIGLLDLRRVTATVLAITVISIATIQLAVVDIPLGGEERAPRTELQDGPDSAYGGLENGSSILGDPEDVPAGEEELDATVDTSGSGSGDDGTGDSAAAYDTGGFGDPSRIDTQRAGFSEREQLEDAELIREYNLRIREGADENE